uniref:Uncharacterized protein n=1 Tax=Nymphaea colorata TaxID=210225 RepID=A0A5K1GJ84_9MAGN
MSSLPSGLAFAPRLLSSILSSISCSKKSSNLFTTLLTRRLSPCGSSTCRNGTRSARLGAPTTSSISHTISFSSFPPSFSGSNRFLLHTRLLTRFADTMNVDSAKFTASPLDPALRIVRSIQSTCVRRAGLSCSIDRDENSSVVRILRSVRHRDP